MRTDDWLVERLDYIWNCYFDDVLKGFPIIIRWGPAAQRRFGSIRAKDKQSLILINGLFRRPEVPDFVIDGTMVHELAHYVHGFGSGLPKKYANPHQGGVITKELTERGCQHLEAMADKWRENNWQQFYESTGKSAATKLRNHADDLIWERYLGRPGMRSQEDLETIYANVGRKLLLPLTFEVSWLKASTKVSALSYRYPKNNQVKVHGLLANGNVPECVIEYELLYWLLTTSGISNWKQIQAIVHERGLIDICVAAGSWKSSKWQKFRKINHPLYNG